MTAFVDSNVLIDVLAPPSLWRSWSVDRLLEWAARGPLLINDIVYAEVSVGFESQPDLDRAVSELGLERAELTPAALFTAGRAFRQYRKNEGSRALILPDFIIGAHAATMAVPLITRDVRRFKTYFPDLTIIAPNA